MCVCCWKPTTKGSVNQHRRCSVSQLMDPSLPNIHTLQPSPHPFLCSAERRSITPRGPLVPLRFSAMTAQWLCPMNGVSTAPFIVLSVVMLSLIRPFRDGGHSSLYNTQNKDLTHPSCVLFFHRGKGRVWNHKVWYPLKSLPFGHEASAYTIIFDIIRFYFKLSIKTFCC